MNEVKLEPKEGTFLARIKELEARVAELERENAELKAKLNPVGCIDVWEYYKDDEEAGREAGEQR